MRLFELVIEDPTQDGVFALSLVDEPAIESHGIYFNRDEVMFKETEEEGLFVAPILIPDKKIMRVDGSGVPYEVYLSKDTVKQLAHMYLKNKFQDSFTIQHDRKIDNVTLVESWITDSSIKDKSKQYGLSVPAGTWMGLMSIDSEELREKFRSGEVSAISIEGIFQHLEKTTPERLQSAMLMESFADYMIKDVEELSDVEAELVLKKIKGYIKKDRRFKENKRLDFESYSDYGDGVKNNAKKAVEWADKNGWGSCGTGVGKARANQLAKGEPISVETIKRMYSYLSRHEGDLESSTSFGDGCGYLMYQAWGGKAALGWSRNKLRELGLLEENQAQPSVTSTYPGEASGSYVSPETLEDNEMDIYGYQTEYFYICPGAIGTFQRLLDMELEEDVVDMVRAAAVFADMVFDIEEDVVEDMKASPKDLRKATTLVEMFKDIFETIVERTGEEFDISYMDGHIEVIKKYL